MMLATYPFRHTSMVLTILFCYSSSVLASGFTIPERSAAGIALANALVANTRDLNALAYNPSVAVFHKNASLSSSLMFIKPTVGVTPEGGSYKESLGEDNILIPGLSGHINLADYATLVLNVNTPFGLETRWETGTFPIAAAYDPLAGASGGIATGSTQPTESKFEVLGFSPSIAFKLGENAAMAFGVDYYSVREVVFSAAAKKNSGDGDGVGYNLSFSSQLNDKIDVGISYHSPATIDITGTTVSDFTGSSSATTELTLPWRVQVGIHTAVTEDLSVEFDVTRTGWNNFDTLNIYSDSPTTSVNNWEDVNAYHIGVQYALNNKTQLRFGYSYDKTGRSDDYFSARTPDNDRHLFGIGIGYQLGDGWNLDAGYMYAKLEDHVINSSNILTAPQRDLNGSNAYNGTYEVDVHLLGLTVTKQF